MEERLVDVLNDKNNVLHVLPVVVESHDTPLRDTDFTQEALKIAVAKDIVPEAEADLLRARLHVSRGGQLAPYGDALQVKCDQEKRFQQRIRDRAYFLWQEAGCAEGRADDFWYSACELQGAAGD